jgi:hypothetical protein
MSQDDSSGKLKVHIRGNIDAERLRAVLEAAGEGYRLEFAIGGPAAPAPVGEHAEAADAPPPEAAGDQDDQKEK